MPVEYFDSARVTARRKTTPPRCYSRTGYGNKLPTSWLLRFAGRWHRVYVICFSNSGSAYVLEKGKRLFLGSYDPGHE